MSDTPTIRPAHASEAELLSALALRSKAHWGYPKAFMDACREELAVSPGDIDASPRDYVVCEVGGIVVGFFAVEPLTDEEYELEALFVEPEYIGHGCGRALIEEAKRLALRRGAKSLLIQGDPHAEAFYLAAGGVRIGQRESDSIPGRYLPEFRVPLAGGRAT